MGTASFGNGWEGRVVEGRFPLLEQVGGAQNCGSFLTVLRGLQEAVIQLILIGGSEADARIAQWDFAMALSHPHLSKIFAAGRCTIDHSDLVYVVTERSYATLAKIIQSRTLKANTAIEIFNPVVNALSYLHENGVVHGYVNPSNIQLADLMPKLSVTELLWAGAAKRIPKPGNYDAPELQHGDVTAAADTWSVGMTLCEAMTQALPSWESSGNDDPEIPASLPSPIREIVQDCLRTDPLRRCTIQSILERLDGNMSVPISDDANSVKVDLPLAEATPTPTGETPTADEPFSLSSQAENIGIEEPSEASIFSKSLGRLEETHLPRFRFMPYAVSLLAIIAFIAVLLVRAHKAQTPSAVESQNAPAISQPRPQEQAVAPVSSTANSTDPETGQLASKTQPDAAPQTETQSAPTQSQPVPQPPSAADHGSAEENKDGLVAKRVLPAVSPGARGGMRRPVEVLMRVSVNQHGTVSDVAYVSPGPGNYFARVCQRAARSWEFTPPMRNGDPEPSVWTLRFYFEKEKTEVTAIKEK